MKQFTIQLHCICALPASYDERMVECEDCEKWYHYKCVRLKEDPQVRTCASCRDELVHYIIIIIIILYLSAHVQRTKRALGIAPREALFKKNKHTQKVF